MKSLFKAISFLKASADSSKAKLTGKDQDSIQKAVKLILESPSGDYVLAFIKEPEYLAVHIRDTLVDNNIDFLYDSKQRIFFCNKDESNWTLKLMIIDKNVIIMEAIV